MRVLSIRSGIVRLAVALFIVILGAAIVPAGGQASKAEIAAKRAAAERLLAELRSMDAELEDAIESYNGASVQLGVLRSELTVARRHLKIANDGAGQAQRRLEQRLVALYVNGEPDVIEILLGASNLDDLLNRLDTAERVSSQDVEILEQLREARTTIAREEKRLGRALAAQERLVAERTAKREEIEDRLGVRQAYYESIKNQISQLEAEERERARRLAAEAREREAEQRRLAEAAEAAGVQTPEPPARADALPEYSTPEGMGTAPGGRLGQQAAQIALRYLGIRYVWGAADPDVGFDCSGLTMYVYAQLGVSLPHNAAMQYGYGVPVSASQLQPGDLVFYRNLGHMGMYIGNGQYIAAPQTGDVVRIFNMSDRSDLVGARRVA